MKSARELLESYLANIQTPAASAALFAADGVLELPWVNAHAKGPAGVEALVKGILGRVPEFGFKNLKVWIETPDRVFGEYQVEALIPATGKIYHQTYAGLLIAEGGEIKLLREALDTAAAARAFGPQTS